MDIILELLQKDARTTPQELAKLTKSKTDAVKKKIKKYEKEGILLAGKVDGAPE